MKARFETVVLTVVVENGCFEKWFHDSMLDSVGFCLRLSLTVMLTVMTHSH